MHKLTNDWMKWAVGVFLAGALAICGQAASDSGTHPTKARPPVKWLPNGQAVLSPSLRQSLVQHFPGFHRVGDICTGDFDSNGLEDAALYLSDRRRGLPLRQSTWLLVALHQTASGAFLPYVADKRRDPSTQLEPGTGRHTQFSDYGLVEIGAGSSFPVKTGRHHTRQMQLRHDAFFESYDGYKIWFFEGGRYHWAMKAGGIDE
jgi:hypothetical protein